MKPGVYECDHPRRKILLEASPDPLLNGIDFLEVTKIDQTSTTIVVHFIRAIAAGSIAETNVRIEGGVRFPAPKVIKADRLSETLTLTVEGATDYSYYTLRLVESPSSSDPPPHYDPLLSSVKLSFKVLCPNDYDCLARDDTAAPRPDEPHIDYLAKDFNSFRTQMLDRMSVLMPDWKERNLADVGIAIVEVLAYAGDYLSYYQDAVATEAYLGTARKRASVRRHARLLDYRLHDGCNARTWLHFSVKAALVNIPAGTQVLSRHRNLPVLPLRTVIPGGIFVFETLYAATLREALNQIEFHTWGDESCCLPTGSTQASFVLKDSDKTLFSVGDVVLVEEVRDPDTGVAADADSSKRHVVRLTSVDVEQDLVMGLTIANVAWDAQDALPFDLHVGTVYDKDTKARQQISFVRGNLVLADHGRTMTSEELPAADADGRVPLPLGPITQKARVPSRRGIPRGPDNRPIAYDPRGPAVLARQSDPRLALPELSLRPVDDDAEVWLPQHDLLGSDRFAKEFVVETEEDGSAEIRFGDGTRGEKPPTDTALTATYRIGNGRRGNVGADTLVHVMTGADGIDFVRNPLPALGGQDPETSEKARIYAPQAFLTPLRAVTLDDYARTAEKHPEVQRAVALRRWTGSWYTIVLLVDRKGGKAVDTPFEETLVDFLDGYRMAGYDIEVAAPRFAPLDIAMTVCCAPDVFRSNVKAALKKVFHRFFAPDELSFGQSIYLSEVIATAMAQPGVLGVDLDPKVSPANRFQRYGKTPQGEYEAGKIAIRPLEVARLDDDPNFPENGRLEFTMRGGR